LSLFRQNVADGLMNPFPIRAQSCHFQVFADCAIELGSPFKPLALETARFSRSGLILPISLNKAEEKRL
jgi:hypothetical protein